MSEDKVKPGYKTSEFYFVLAAVVVGMLIASGAISETSSWGKAIAFVATALTAMGYTFVRGSVKTDGTATRSGATLTSLLDTTDDDGPPDQ